MKSYWVTYTEDCPCYAMIELKAAHDGEAIARALAYDWSAITTEPNRELADRK